MAKELNLGVIFYGVATKAMQSIEQLEARLKKLNAGFVVSGKAATGSSKAMSVQTKSAKGLANEMSLVGKKIGQVTGGIQRLTAAMKVTASYGLAATAIFGVINAFKAGTAAIFDFDQALKNLQAITGATDAEIAVLGDKIREVAATTKYSAKEVSDAAVLLGQAGFDAAESLDAIEAVAMLATGTLTEMATTADLLTTAIRAFSLETSESGRVADIFASAVNKSKLTIDKLRTAFNYLGPVASNAGLSLEETAAATMVLANAGLRGSTIGTGFRQVISRLIAPSEKLRLAFRAAGADLEKLNPLTNDFSVVLDELSKVVTHSGIAIRLFGMRASAAAVAIAKGSEQYKEMLDYTYRVGVATEMAEKQMEGLAVMAKNLGDKLGILAVALGEGGIAGAFKVVLNVLRPLIDLLTLAANTITGRFIVAVTSLTAVIAALALAFNYLNIQLMAIAWGTTVLDVKAAIKVFGKWALMVDSVKLAFSGLVTFLAAHKFLAVIGLAASAAAAFGLWSKSTTKQTLELQKQSIELDKSIYALEGYLEQLWNVEEGSRKHEAIVERLIKAYPDLRREVDLETTSIHDQVDAIERLIKIKAAEHLQTELQVYLRLSETVRKHAKELAFLIQRRKDAFGSDQSEKIKKYAEEAEELADTTKYLTKVMAHHLKILEDATGVDFSSSIQNIEKYVRRRDAAFTTEEVKLWAERIKAHFDEVGKLAKALGTTVEKELRLFSNVWWEVFDNLRQTNVAQAQDLLALFDKTLKEVAKLEEDIGADPKEVKKSVEKLKKLRLETFIAGLSEQKKEYKEFFNKIKQMRLKALGEDEASEKKAAENRHATRMAGFKKDFESREDYLVQEVKAEERSHELMEKEKLAITNKYLKKRLNDRVESEIELEKLLLEIAKRGVDERVAAGLTTIAEGNHEKAQLEVLYHRDVLRIYTDIFKDVKTKYGEDTKEYRDALNDKLKAEAEYEKARGKLITIDTEDLGAAEKIYKQFLNNVQDAFADTFYDIFKNQWEGWEDLLEKMKDLAFKVFSEIAAEAIMTKIELSFIEKKTEAQKTESASASAGLGTSIGAGIALFTVSQIWESYKSDKAAEKERKREEQEALRKLNQAIIDINAEIKDALSIFSEFTNVLLDVHEKFTAYAVTLAMLGAGVEQLSKIEKQRIEVLEKVRQELEEGFIAPLKDMIASFTLAPMEYELYKLDTWYASLIDNARSLGDESIRFLREAYDISKKQLALKEQEVMLSMLGGFEDIIATIGRSAIEVQLYYLEQAGLEAGVDVSEFQASIDALEFAITGYQAQILALTDELTVAVSDFETGFKAPTSPYTAGGEGFFIPEMVAQAMDPGWLELAGISESLSYSEKLYESLKAIIEYMADVGITSTELINTELAILESAWLAHQEAYLPVITGIPTEISGIQGTIADTLADITDLEALMADLIAVGGEAYELQLAALRESVPEGWAEIIRDLTLSDFEKGLFALNEWYAEQLIAAKALGLSTEKLTEAYGLQQDVIDATAAAISTTIQDALWDLSGLQDPDAWLKQLAARYDWPSWDYLTPDIMQEALDWILSLSPEEIIGVADALGITWQTLLADTTLLAEHFLILDDAINDTIASIDDMIESLTGGALAPVQSAEFYTDKYAGLIEAAMMGTAGAVDELLAFIPDYLDFMGDYGGDYAGIVAAIVAQLENLKLTLPGLQHGGLTSGLSFAGERGPEWIVPTYEPQRSQFLDDVGMDPVTIGRTIAGELLASGGKEIHIHVDVSQRELGHAIAREFRSNAELIDAVRRVN